MFLGVNPSTETAEKTQILRQKEMKITRLPIKPVTDLGNKFLPRPVIRHPRSGRRGTK